jgi:Histidine phosphatase superfamily (branch 1)
MELTRRPFVSAGAAIAAASLTAVTPIAPPPLESKERAVQLLTGEEEITLDLVRHGLNGPPSYQSIVGSFLPGYPLNATGEEQAQALVPAIEAEFPNSIAAIYAGDNIRMPETVQPLADALGMNVQLLPGLDEIPGGIYNGAASFFTPGGILYELTLLAWGFGLEFVPMPGSYDINGVAFDEDFSAAVQTIYDNTVSAGGPTTDIAASGEAAISTWVLMNVNNPDLNIFIPLFIENLLGTATFLPNAGQVVVEGSPGDWTLVSFNGEAIPAPDLLTELFVDVRNLIEAPQTAAYNIFESLLLDPTTTLSTIQTGLSDIATATAQFPVAVIDDILNALGVSTSSDLSADLTNLLSTAATDISGLLPGELGTALAATLTPL